jgi:hypothetical protein
MDPTDLLMLAAQAANAMRHLESPEAGLALGYKFLRKRPPKGDADDPLPVRVARLCCAAGGRRADLLRHLWSQPKSVVVLNRPDDEGDEAPVEPDPEAQRIYDKLINSRRKVKRRDMFEGGFPSFELIRRQGGGSFGGRWVRQGRSAFMKYKLDGLQERVRGIIHYPLEVPVLFPIEVGPEPWSLWDVCCAFADQYVRIYEHPGRYGVWGHDLSDLAITGLTYYPDHELIDADISS